jgi:uncharacterized membrane protein YhhN
MTSFRALFAYFAIVAVAHLAFLAAGASVAADVTQVAAMPILAVALLKCSAAARSGGRLTRWTLLALGFSWLGDSVPRFLSGDAAFMAMVGGFLLAQLAYITAFAPRWRLSILAHRRWWFLPYAALFVALVVICVPHAGGLAPVVTVYGLTLVTMAVLATGVHRLAWVGGALFFVSDGLIALRAFAPWWPLQGAAGSITVMTTYFAGQLLLVIGVLRTARTCTSPGSPSRASAQQPG